MILTPKDRAYMLMAQAYDLWKCLNTRTNACAGNDDAYHRLLRLRNKAWARYYRRLARMIE